MVFNVMTLVVLVAVSVHCSSEFAHAVDKEIPVAIDLKMGAKSVRFEHKKHITSLHNVCVYCHLSENGKIDGGFGRDTARVLCIPCHDEELVLETDCRDCHNESFRNAQKK